MFGMIKIYTTSSSASSRKTIEWFSKFGMEYTEIRKGLKNVKGIKWTKEELKEILSKTENGFEDIVSERCKDYYRYEKIIPDMTTDQLINSIIEYPNLLKYPIIVGDKFIMTGYNHEDIQVFLKPEIRKKIIDYWLYGVELPEELKELIKDETD